uniref:PGG domain-containing protein n=2 Tax=Quercus lobata TaxID=97700 RepID=A0A7N2LM45_QUELO
MEMTQMRREGDDVIDLYKATGSGCRDDTTMEITNEGGDDIVHLYNASASGCTTTLKSLIDKDPRILYKISLTSFSETPLHISALLGHLDFTRILLAQNPHLAVELDSHKRCSLHLASAEGHIEIVKELLHANEDTCSIYDEDGKIPLHYAAMRGRIEVVKALIAVRPDSTRVMLNWKETTLHLCVKYNQLEALKLLVDSVSDEGEFLNFKDHEGGNTILHLAVMLRQIETVKYLLSVSKVGEEVDSLNYMGFTALQMLEQNCPKDFKSFTIRNILMDVGARVERVNNLSPLSAVAVGHHESVEPIPLRKNWLKYLKYQGDWVEDNRGAIMVVATVITTIAFQNIAKPPGGVWQANTTDFTDSKGNPVCTPRNPCYAGNSVFAYGGTTNMRYLYFSISNTISFVASLSVTFLLISGFPIKNKVCVPPDICSMYNSHITGCILFSCILHGDPGHTV